MICADCSFLSFAERQKRASRGGVQRRNVLHSRLAPDAASCALIVLWRPAGAARDVESMFVCFLSALSFDLVALTRCLLAV